MNIDPTMPTLTLGLSEWRHEGVSFARYWIRGDRIKCAARVWANELEVISIGNNGRGGACDSIEDGMSKADAMLREWIEGVLG